MKTAKKGKILILLLSTATVFGLSDKELDLFRAVLAGNLAGAENALAAKANVNAQDKDGVSALHTVADSGQLNIVNSLIEAKAKINIKDKKGQTPLDYAKRNNHQAVVDALKAAGTEE